MDVDAAGVFDGVVDAVGVADVAGIVAVVDGIVGVIGVGAEAFAFGLPVNSGSSSMILPIIKCRLKASEDMGTLNRFCLGDSRT